MNEELMKELKGLSVGETFIMIKDILIATASRPDADIGQMFRAGYLIQGVFTGIKYLMSRSEKITEEGIMKNGGIDYVKGNNIAIPTAEFCIGIGMNYSLSTDIEQVLKVKKIVASTLDLLEESIKNKVSKREFSDKHLEIVSEIIDAK